MTASGGMRTVLRPRASSHRAGIEVRILNDSEPVPKRIGDRSDFDSPPTSVTWSERRSAKLRSRANASSALATPHSGCGSGRACLAVWDEAEFKPPTAKPRRKVHRSKALDQGRSHTTFRFGESGDGIDRRSQAKNHVRLSFDRDDCARSVQQRYAA